MDLDLLNAGLALRHAGIHPDNIIHPISADGWDPTGSLGTAVPLRLGRTDSHSG